VRYLTLTDILSTALLASSETQKQIWIYAAGDSVHAAAMLEMRGNIMSGVRIEPATLNFGEVEEAQGASRTVRIAYAAALYREGRTRLIAPGSSPLDITPLPARRSEAGETHSAGARPNIVRSYRISLPPHAPLGALSGELRVVGLARRTLPPYAAGTKVRPPAVTRGLPFVGQVKGRISAQPGMAVFGVVSLSNRAAASSLSDRQQRTRWILLKREASPTATSPAKSRPAALWKGATVRIDSVRFQAALVAPTHKAGSSPQTLTPPPVAVGVSPEDVYWLRLTLMPSAPRGRSLTAQATVSLADGERLRVPILAQTE
jgi:hypothetical protein